MTLAHGVRKFEEKGLASRRAGRLGAVLGVRGAGGIAHHARIFIGATADFEEIETGGDKERDLGHCLFKGVGAVVGGVELDANGKVCRDNLAGFGENVEDEACALFGSTTVIIVAAVSLKEIVVSTLINAFPSHGSFWAEYRRLNSSTLLLKNWSMVVVSHFEHTLKLGS